MVDKIDSVTVGLWWKPNGTATTARLELAVHSENVRQPPTYLDPPDAVVLAYRLLTLAACAGEEVDVDALLSDLKVELEVETRPPCNVSSSRLLEWLTSSDFEGVEDDFLLGIEGHDSSSPFSIPLGHLRSIVEFLEGAKDAR